MMEVDIVFRLILVSNCGLAIRALVVVGGFTSCRWWVLMNFSRNLWGIAW